MDWKFWKRKEEPATPPSVSSQEADRSFGQLSPPALRKLKWVFVENVGRVGIITSLDPGNMVNVDLVQDDGTTYSSLRTQAGNVRIARLAEIPLCRRPTNPAYALSLGYY